MRTLESHENMDKYLQEAGVPEEAIKKVFGMRPTLSLTKNGDEYTLVRKGTLRGDRPPLKFKHMQEIHSKSIVLLYIHHGINFNSFTILYLIYISNLKDHMDKPIVTVINVVSPQKHIATIKHERGVTTITSEIVNGKKVLVSIN